MYIAIDPGVATGWATWDLDGLVGCGLGDSGCRGIMTDAWIESPVIYPRSKARPANVMAVMRNAGEWGGRFAEHGVLVHYVEPAKWKGKVAKSVCHERLWASLDERARHIVKLVGAGLAPSKRHNVLDAVALGQWAHRKVYP